MKKLIAGIVTIAVLSLVLTTYKKPVDIKPLDNSVVLRLPELAQMSKEQAIASINVLACDEIIKLLCSSEYAGRMTGHTGNVKAAQWLNNQFLACNLQVQLQQFPWTKGVNPGPNKEQGDAFSSNVIGVLPGQSDKCLIVGGDFDHLGYGPRGSRWGAGQIHPGADDNASGIAVVVSVAKAINQMSYKPKCTILFMGFSGEEMGLIGSTYYCRNPIKPLAQTTCMINMDMVGRLKGKTTLSLGGNKQLQNAIDAVNKRSGLQVVIHGGGGGGSDHAPFAEKGVPTVFFHTGLHDDYHTPSDTPDKIDVAGVVSVARYVCDLLIELDQR